MFSARIQQRGDAGKVIERLEAALRGPSRVKVGFPMGQASTDIVMRAIWSEFGTKGSGKPFVRNGVGGFGGPIPERPFFRGAMRDNRSKYRDQMRTAARSILRGELEMSTALNRLGLGAVGDVQASIVALRDPPNAPLTVEIKGSSNPLVDSGELRQRVSHVIDQE